MGHLAILGPPMWRRLRFNPVLLWTVVLAVLAVRLADTHLHLCFDGQEAPTSVHLADASIHHDLDPDLEHEDGPPHADQDIDPFIGTVAKSDDDTQPLFALIVGTLLTIEMLSPDRAVPAVDRETLLPTPPPFYLRPPLRGPPA